MGEVPYNILKDSSKNLTSNEGITGSDANYRLKAGLFFTSVTAISALLAFGMTLASVKRRDPSMFEKGCRISPDLHESGTELALRALKHATFYSLCGCSLISFGIWKLTGASNMEEFRYKMGIMLPKIRRNDPPQGRTEFSGLTDFLKYLTEDYEKDILKLNNSKPS